MSQDYKAPHKDYYANVEGPIGGPERFQWVARTFFDNTRGKKILEIGCGEGSLLQLIRANNEVHGVDISESGVEKCLKKNIPCVHADASTESLPYADDTFDIVITLETIEHVENPHRMLWEIKRILKLDGTLLISVPGEKVYHPFIYPGLFSRKNFTDFLTANGLEITDVKGWGQAPLLAHWMEKAKKSSSRLTRTWADFLYFIGRKRNLLMRKRLGTPLSWAYCTNYVCLNRDKSVSRVAQVAEQTTPH